MTELQSKFHGLIDAQIKLIHQVRETIVELPEKLFDLSYKTVGGDEVFTMISKTSETLLWSRRVNDGPSQNRCIKVGDYNIPLEDARLLAGELMQIELERDE